MRAPGSAGRGGGDGTAKEGWQALLCVYAWLSSAAGGLGAASAQELGSLLGPPARKGEVRFSGCGRGAMRLDLRA